MTDDSIRERSRANASEIAAVVVTGTWLAMLMLDFSSELWLAVMLFGYIAVVPVVSMLFDEDEQERVASEDDQQTVRTDSASTPNAESDDALERLRRRYAEGKLTDEQFERKLERLLETETLEDVESRLSSGRSSERDSDADAADRDSRSMERDLESG